MLDQYYQVLELQAGASKDEVREAFRDLLKVWHPDRFNDDSRLRTKAEQKTRELICAYEAVMGHLSQGRPAGQQRPNPAPRGSPEIRPHFNAEFMASHSERMRAEREDRDGRERRSSHGFFATVLFVFKLPLIILDALIQSALSWALGVAMVLLCIYLFMQVDRRSHEVSTRYFNGVVRELNSFDQLGKNGFGGK